MLLLLAAGAAVISSCGGDASTGGSSASGTPTKAYKALYEAVKAKDMETVKGLMSQRSMDLAKMASEKQGKPVESVLENGFTATTFSPSVPEIRDERVKGEFGSIEVWNARDGVWEDLPFVAEGGKWKLAVGDLFSGSFKSPGKGRDLREKEAANAANPPRIEQTDMNAVVPQKGKQPPPPPANQR